MYDPKAMARLRSRGCGVDEFTGYRHEQVDEAPALVALTIELVRSAAIGTGVRRQLDGPRQCRYKAVA